MKDLNSNITVGEFVTALIEYSPDTISSYEHAESKPFLNDYMHYGYDMGWLEEMDLTDRDTPLLKKNAARIAHEFIRLQLHEPDSENINAAAKMRDIYDCRVCTKHIMQMVAKGIMEGYYITDTLYLFGINDPVTQKEAQTIIKRIFRPNMRIIP